MEEMKQDDSGTFEYGKMMRQAVSRFNPVGSDTQGNKNYMTNN